MDMGELRARCAVERRLKRDGKETGNWRDKVRDGKRKGLRSGCGGVRDGKRKGLGSGCGGMSGGDAWRGIIAEPAKRVKQNQLRSEHNGFSRIRG